MIFGINFMRTTEQNIRVSLSLSFCPLVPPTLSLISSGEEQAL